MGSRSRAQQNRASTSAATRAEDTNIDDTNDDPVLNVVKFGFNNVKMYINETLPKCPTGIFT